MYRPLSIRRFERLYLAALALGVASSLFDWPFKAATLARDPNLAGYAWLLPASVLTDIVLRLTLWYFTARRPKVFAKWFVVIRAAIAFAFLLFGLVALMTGATPSLAGSLFGIMSGALYVTSAAYLFRADAKAWFEPFGRVQEEVGV